jgi:tetratricopeptide (TPR) repeat protein
MPSSGTREQKCKIESNCKTCGNYESRASGRWRSYFNVKTNIFKEIFMNAMDYVMRGVEYKIKGDHNAAIKEFTSAIELDPKNFDAYAFRGFEYSQLDEWDKAISDYTQAIIINQRDSDYLSRGGAYFMIEKFKEARDDFETALYINPNNDEAKEAMALLESIGH